ncbi:carboxypeptidase-like regulatory domain-containing protein [Sphingobacterium shayense]|nr:carboxypeptidase-like regulatory domain-containing protein [Sphingobacterium shayense]
MQYIKDLKKHIIGLIGILLLSFSSLGQTVHIKGKVMDVTNKEPVGYATVAAIGTSYATSTDDAGDFHLEIKPGYSKIRVSFVGYVSKDLTISTDGYQEMVVYLMPEENTIEAVSVKAPKRSKYSNRNNPAVELIRKVIDHKDQNRLAGYDYAQFQQYEKVSLGLSNLSEKFKNRKIFKNYQFLFEKDDSSHGNPESGYTLPAYIEERLSKVFSRRKPNKIKQLIIAEQRAQFDPKFVDNDGLSTYFNKLYQDIDIYDSNIELVTNQFLSPIAGSSPTFYKFYITDTIKTQTPYLVELAFFPRNKADMLFQGKLYITLDGKYAVKRAELSVSNDINLNFVRDLDVKLDFEQDPEKKYYLKTSSLGLDFSLTNKGTGIRGNRTVTYDQFKTGIVQPDSVYEGDDVVRVYKEKDEKDKVETEEYLATHRPIPLQPNEVNIYHNVDTLQLIPSFQRFMDISSLVLSGFKQAGPLEIGPVNTFYSFNPVEGFRLRVGGRTTDRLSKKFYAEGYTAYGFKDQKWKYFIAGTYALNNKSVYTFPQHYLRGSVMRDTKIPGQNLEFVQEDNFLLSFKRGENLRYLYNDIYRLEYKREFENNFSYTIGLSKWKQQTAGILSYQQVDNLGNKTVFDELNTTELSVSLRYAPHEEFYQGKNYRTPLFNKYPIFYLNYVGGLKDILQGEYNYHNFTLGVDKRFYFSQLGYADVNLEGNYIIGDDIPFPFLNIHRANQTYAYQLRSYNLMNFLEFVSDQSVATNVQYYMNGFILNKIPLIKKLQWREVFSVKAIYGGLRESNNPAYNQEVFQFQKNENDEPITYGFGSKPYVEASVGLTNIFKFVRVDYVRRLNYTDLPDAPKHGIRVRVKFDF